MFFVLFALVTLFFAYREGQNPQAEGSAVSLTWMAVFSLAALLVGVIFHEVGHYYAALLLGGQMKESVLTPLGGFKPAVEPADPLRAVAVHLAGPGANLVICLLCLPGLMFGFSSADDFFGLLNPLAPMASVTHSPWDTALKLFFWVNWVLVLVNLIPAFPFDGGRAARAALSRLWERGGRRTAGALVARAAQFSAIGLGLVAWLTREVPAQGAAAPLWFALLLIAVFLLFSARQEPEAVVAAEEEEPVPRRRDGHLVAPWQYESPDDYTPQFPSTAYDDEYSSGFSSDEEATSPYGWLEQRREERREHDRETEAEEEERVDEILARVHEHGMSSLSPEDRELLNRVSRRYRQRPGNPS